jgi:hypothetical protein
MDQNQFDDFIKANGEELGPELVAEATLFMKRLVIANRLWKAAFGHLPEGPQGGNPGELQGTLMMLKLQDDLSGSLSGD